MHSLLNQENTMVISFAPDTPLILPVQYDATISRMGEITMNTDWESFFDQPIAIFDQTSKTVTSPIHYPNIYHLINAWYYNYSTILTMKKFKSAIILYENLIANQAQEIKKSLKK